MNRVRSTILVSSLSALLVALCVYAAEEPAELENADAKIRALQQERVDVLQRGVDLVLAGYRNGTLDYKTVHATHHELLNAKLEMAGTRTERIHLLTAQLKIAQEALALAEARYRAAFTTALDFYQAKSTVLQIEIQILKLQQLDAAKKPD